MQLLAVVFLIVLPFLLGIFCWSLRRVSTTLRHMHREFIEFYFLCWAAC
jgi:hypothetical protein